MTYNSRYDSTKGLVRELHRNGKFDINKYKWLIVISPDYLASFYMSNDGNKGNNLEFKAESSIILDGGRKQLEIALSTIPLTKIAQKSSGFLVVYEMSKIEFGRYNKLLFNNYFNGKDIARTRINF